MIGHYSVGDRVVVTRSNEEYTIVAVILLQDKVLYTLKPDGVGEWINETTANKFRAVMTKGHSETCPKCGCEFAVSVVIDLKGASIEG